MMKNKKYRGLISLCAVILCLCMMWPVYKENRDLKESLAQMDLRLSTEFDMCKSSLVRELRSGACSTQLAVKSEQFHALCLPGDYLGEHKIASDPLWRDISGALCEVLEDPDIFQCLTEEDMETIISFLESHEYRNDPAISEDDVQRIKECTQPALILYFNET